MSQNVTGFRWTKRREQAAYLVADDTLSDEEIARQCRVSQRTVARWKAVPEFQRRVEEHRAAWREAVRSHGIAVKERRILALADKVRRLEQILAERAARGGVEPGSSTGLLVRQLKAAGAGRHQQLVEEYVLDAPLLREYRELLRQVAQELGEWIDKREDRLDLTDQFLSALREFGRGHHA